jgi:hypothetical protein
MGSLKNGKKEKHGQIRVRCARLKDRQAHLKRSVKDGETGFSRVFTAEIAGMITSVQGGPKTLEGISKEFGKKMFDAYVAPVVNGNCRA